MTRLLFIVSCIWMLSSCSPLKLTGNYPDTHHYIECDNTFKNVWSEIIDYLTYAGIPIETIDRSSGLIETSSISLIDHYTREKDGRPIDPDAYAVIPTIRSGLVYILEPKPPINAGWTMTGKWNIRIKVSDGKTAVRINLISLECRYASSGHVTQIPIRSTGKFEQGLLEHLTH